MIHSPQTFSSYKIHTISLGTGLFTGGFNAIPRPSHHTHTTASHITDVLHNSATLPPCLTPHHPIFRTPRTAALSSWLLKLEGFRPAHLFLSAATLTRTSCSRSSWWTVLSLSFTSLINLTRICWDLIWLKFSPLYIVRFHRRRRFHQTLSVNADPQDLSDQPLLLDMIFLGTPQLRGGVNIFFFYKVSFEKHPNVHVWGTFSIFKCVCSENECLRYIFFYL